MPGRLLRHRHGKPLTVWAVLAGIAVALLAGRLALVAALLFARPRGSLLAEAVGILPDLLRLPRRLAADSTLPTGARVRIGMLLAYLALPIDLIPDFVPGIGYADDAIITAAMVPRSTVRRAGIEAVRRHWPGTQDGFTALQRPAGIGTPGERTGASDTGEAHHLPDGTTGWRTQGSE